MQTDPDLEGLSVSSSMASHSSGLKEGVADNCLPVNRAIKTNTNDIDVLVDWVWFGQVAAGDASREASLSGGFLKDAGQLPQEQAGQSLTAQLKAMEALIA